MATTLEAWPVQAIREATAPWLPGLAVEVLPEVDSTNSELMRRARAGLAAPVLLVAERQSAGRGRQGRGWASGIGDSLTFSLGLPLAPAGWSGLSLVVGVAVAEALHPDIGLKWPNDLWVGGRKLAGILVETGSLPQGDTATCMPPDAGRAPARFAVAGIGVNIAPRSSEGLSTPPAALRELWPAADAAGALLRIAAPLARALREFEAQGFASFQGRFADRDLLRGREVTLSDGLSGIARGVDPSGALLVQSPQGLQVVTSSEVSVRPVSA